MSDLDRNTTAPADLESIYHLHYDAVIRTAYYIVKNEEDARDLAQELFARLWVQPPAWHEVRNQRGYLIRAIKNRAMDYIENEKKLLQKQEDHLKLNFTETEDITDLEAPTNELEHMISRFVSELPPQCRLIFSLSRFEGLTNQEIADHLGISKRTVETQISLALKNLRTRMKSKDNPFRSMIWVVLPASLSLII